ncbi:DUF3762 domain-containing protein [Paenibacillus sp. 28ISP30-2]|nr:DUF3762 domain-containing protein [Paenibacillus sp. 28ISP30-2]
MQKLYLFLPPGYPYFQIPGQEKTSASFPVLDHLNWKSAYPYSDALLRIRLAYRPDNGHFSAVQEKLRQAIPNPAQELNRHRHTTKRSCAPIFPSSSYKQRLRVPRSAQRK